MSYIDEQIKAALERFAEQFLVCALAHRRGKHCGSIGLDAFGIRRIVDIALRALSSGINDTTTAVMSVGYLTPILARLASPHDLTQFEQRLRQMRSHT